MKLRNSLYFFEYPMTLWNLFSVSTFIICLVGCVSNPEYPDEWATILADDDCRNIEGYFEDKAEIPDGHRHSTFDSIYIMLLGGEPINASGVQYVEIAQKDNELVIKAFIKEFLGQEWVEERRFSFDSDECRHGFLKITVPFSTRKYSDNVGYGVYKFYYELAIASDGSLVVATEAYGFETIVIVPALVTKASNWFRFKAKDINEK